MADMYLGDGAGGPESDSGPGAFGTLFNWLGALMSVALIAGLAIWGYQLAVRDVSGVPVVRALVGPMRIAPDDPGGEQAAHQGLAVNSVAAEGAAERPADRLILAPPPLDLSDEDLPRAQLAGAEEVTTPAPVAATQVPQTDALALAEALAEGVTPLSATITPEPRSTDIVPASVRGVSRSPFPRPRPAVDLAAEAVAASVALASAPPVSIDVDPDTLPVGTRLVQFGAYDSPELARAEWTRLGGKFADFLAEKRRVIQRAESGGKTFYRLRAMGFDDINDARRFCSAMLAERQPCIPVVTR